MYIYIYAAYICTDCNTVWRMLQHVAVFPGGGEEGEGSEKGEDVPSEAGASTSKAAFRDLWHNLQLYYAIIYSYIQLYS